MKKAYAPPTVEKISFHYRDQVVAASGDVAAGGGNGSNYWNNTGKPDCYKPSHQSNNSQVCYPS